MTKARFSKVSGPALTFFLMLCLSLANAQGNFKQTALAGMEIPHALSAGGQKQIVNTNVPQAASWTAAPFDFRLFVENKGQFNKATNRSSDKVLYEANFGDIKAYFTPSGIVYKYQKSSLSSEKEKEERERAMAQKKGKISEKEREEEERESEEYEAKYVRCLWVGANSDVQVYAEEEQSYYYTYPMGMDQTIQVNVFKKVIYKNLYPGIDVEYFFPDGKEGLKYNVILHPGANPSLIKLKYPKASISINEKGDAVVKTVMDNFTDHAPVCYYEGGEPLGAHYKINGNEESFAFDAPYDLNRTVIIDPWTTNPVYTGAPANNQAYDIDYDNYGNVYAYGGWSPSQLVKFNSSGVIQWRFNATTINTDPSSQWGDFCVDKVTGRSYIVEGFNPTPTGARVLKVSSAGALVSTFAGNANFEEMDRVAYSVCTHQLVIAGGGTNATNQGCMLDTNMVTFVPRNVLSANLPYHDMWLLAMDPSGSTCYMGSANSCCNNNTSYDDRLLKLNVPALTASTFNFNIRTTFGTWMPEGTSNVLYMTWSGVPANGYNGLTCSKNNLYFYDGVDLYKLNKNTGALVVKRPNVGNNMQSYGGLDVDVCDNLYVGSNSKVFIYNGGALAAGSAPTNTISCSNTVYDVMVGLDYSNVYIGGMGFVSSVANPVTPVTFTNSVTNPTCGSCNGSITANLYECGVATAATYSWSDGQTTQTAAGLCAGTYTVTVTPTTECRTYQSVITLTNGGSLTPTITAAPATLCNGGSTVLTASGGTTYTWSANAGSATTNTVSVSPGGTTVYTVTASTGGCSGTQTISITVTAQPTVSIAGAANICSGNSLVLTGSATSGTYTWNTGPTTSTISVSPGVGTTSYTLNGSNGTCTASAVATVTVTATPTVTISGTTSLCSGQSTILTAATTAGTFTWSANAGGGSAGTVTLTPGTGTTVYTVSGSNGTCTAVKTVTVTVTAQPTVNISGTLTNCSGTPVVLTGATATNYTWLPGGATTSTLSVNPAAGTTTYTLTGANGSCTASAVATVTTTATPTLTVNSPSICSGQSAILTAATANSYSWSTTATTNTISVSPAITTTYNVTGDNGSGCTSTKTATVTVNSTPTISISGASTVCSGNAIVLTAATATNYTWSANAGSATTNTVSVTPGTGTTTYTLTGANGACTATAAITVTATPSPTLTVNSATICSGQSVVLTAATANTYSWSTTATTNTISVSPAVTTTYNVTGDNGGGCTTTKTATVTVNPTPTVAITGQHTICSGVTLILTGATAANYTWLPGGANTPTLSITPPNGSNTYTLIGANGVCTATTTASVDVSPSPTVTVNNATICAGETATLTAGGAATYSWSANAGGVISPSVSVSPGTTTVYTVGGIMGSCVDSTTATVTVAPNPTLTISGNAGICPGASLVLTGGTATTYTWSSNAGSANTNTVSVTPTTNTTYTLTGTTGSCTASIVATVTVNTPPTIGTATVIDAACGQSNGCIDTVLVSGGSPVYQYSWNNGATWSNAASNCNVPAGNYTVQVKDANGCGDTATVSVANLNGPSAPSVAISTASVCAGSTVSLSVNSPSLGITYTWTDVTGTHTGTTYTITNIAPAGNYSVSVTATDNNTSCVSAATTTVIVVNAMPVVTATASPAAICSGQSTVLTASGAPSYTWSSNAGSATTNTVSVSPGGNTTYTVTGDNSGCISTQTISVAVTPSPTISVTPSSVCAGQTTTLTASGATNYTWMPGGATTNTISVTSSTTTTYVVTGDDLGCTGTQTVTVTVTPNPTLTAVASQSVICAGQTTTLTASGAATFTWSPGGPGGSINVSPTGNTTYTVTGANGACVSTETVVVNVNPSPTVSIVPSATAICSGNTATLTANGATNYTWQPGGSTGGTFTDNPTSNTTYTLIGETGGCTDVKTVTINVNPTPTLSAVGNQAVCAGGTVNGITYSSGGASVNWTNTNGNIGLSLSGSGNIGSYTAPSNTVAETGVITATPVDLGTGCVGNTQTFTITIYPAPIVNLGTVDTAKCGIMNGGINGITVSGGTSPIHYQWYDSTAIMTNDTLSTLSGVGPGTYSVWVTDANGCIGTGAGTMPYVVPSIATPTLNITPVLTQGTAPVSVTFTANVSAGVTTYNWNLGDGTTSNLPGPLYTYTNAGTYSVVLTVSNGTCLNRDTAIVIVDAPVLIVVPNIYSPNGDGINDEFSITCVGIEKLHCDIFNRWGQLVYQLLAPNDKWNGIMNNGNWATDGTYFYILDATGYDGKQYKSHGSLTLVR